MKDITFNLDQFAVDKFFKPIRNKTDVISILSDAIKYMLINLEIPTTEIKGYIRLHVDKMSRIHLFSSNKYFSICFPFNVYEIEGKQLFFKTQNTDIIIDSKIISGINAFIYDKKILYVNDVYEFIDLFNNDDSSNMLLWNVLKEFIFFEDGYVRFDADDPFDKKVNPIYHPQHHLDLFYESNATFKIGLARCIAHQEFHNLLDSKEPCYYAIDKVLNKEMDFK